MSAKADSGRAPSERVARLLRTRGRLIGSLVTLISLVLGVLVLLGVDLYLHHRFANRSGVNVAGYRGPILGAKAPGELRVAVLGGSTAFGYRVPTDQSFPAILERKLAARVNSHWSVANLAYNAESAVCFAPTLEHYGYLEPDVVVLYSGYNDINERVYFRQPWDCYREGSIVFRLTGYLPLLPEAIRSAYYQARYGSAERGFRVEQGRMGFLPSWSDWNSDDRLNANAKLVPAVGLPAAQRARYITLITQLVESTLRAARGVLFVTQPYLNQIHRDQQTALRSALARFDGLERFRYVNLGETVDLTDPAVAFDGIHLTQRGNERIASELVGPIEEVASQLSRPTQGRR